MKDKRFYRNENREVGWVSLANAVVEQACIDYIVWKEDADDLKKEVDELRKNYEETFPEELRNMYVKDRAKTERGKQCNRAYERLYNRESRWIRMCRDGETAEEFLNSDRLDLYTDVDREALFKRIRQKIAYDEKRKI